MDVIVSHDPDHTRFVATIDGQTAGQLTYLWHQERFVLDETRVFDGFTGRGVAGALVAQTLDLIRASGDRIVPLCPYVSGWLERHPESADLVDRDLEAEILGTA